MNNDFIEGLTEENIKTLYDDLSMNEDNIGYVIVHQGVSCGGHYFIHYYNSKEFGVDYQCGQTEYITVNYCNVIPGASTWDYDCSMFENETICTLDCIYRS